MKFILLVLLLFTCYCSYGQSSSDTINWRDGYTLKWQDFKGKIDSTSTYSALSYCTVSYTLSFDNSSCKFNVNCFFDKKKSWTTSKADYIIQHEKGHFDISKIFAFKLEKAFTKYKFNASSISKDFKLIFDDLMQQKEKMNQEYDAETNINGYDSLMQKRWENKIKYALKNSG